MLMCGKVESRNQRNVPSAHLPPTPPARINAPAYAYPQVPINPDGVELSEEELARRQEEMRRKTERYEHAWGLAGTRLIRYTQFLKRRSLAETK